MSVHGQVSLFVTVIVLVHNSAAYLLTCTLSFTANCDVPLHLIELLLHEDASPEEVI